MGKKKVGFSSCNSVTLRLFPGYAEEEPSYEVVRVSGTPTTIDIDSLVNNVSEVEDEEISKLETFDGYFPEDGYDYSQHLREINPQQFVAANKRAGPRGIDSKNAELIEVMTALNGFEENIATDFDGEIVQKLGTIDERTRLGLLWGEEHVDEYMAVPTDRLMAIQSRLVEREQQVPDEQADEEFEAFFAREFNDTQIGGLTSDDVIVEHEEDEDVLQEKTGEDFQTELDQIRTEGLAATRQFVTDYPEFQMNIADLPDEEPEIVTVPVAPDWDCQSVLSMHSCIYNHPGKIVRPPRRVANPTVSVLEEVPEEEVDEVAISTFRPKGETSEERKIRKNAVKEFQRDQRSIKSAEKNKMKEALATAKNLAAINKRTNFGDIPAGVPRFAFA